MDDLWGIPSSPDEIPALPVRVKPDWVGWGRFVGAGLWFLEQVFGELALGRWATRVLDVYVQAIGGVIYAQRGRDLERHPLSAASLGHEGLHDWQFRQLGALRFLWRYYATRKGRRHAEAMAYGYEVAIHGADILDAAGKAADPTYGMAWTVDEAAALVSQYAELFREEWE